MTIAAAGGFLCLPSQSMGCLGNRKKEVTVPLDDWKLGVELEVGSSSLERPCDLSKNQILFRGKGCRERLQKSPLKRKAKAEEHMPKLM